MPEALNQNLTSDSAKPVIMRDGAQDYTMREFIESEMYGEALTLTPSVNSVLTVHLGTHQLGLSVIRI